MFIESFDWDENNEMHISRHKVTPDEAEEVFVDSFFYRKTGKERYLGFGRTFDGRYLFVVFAVKAKSRIRIITARDVDARELRFYKRWLGGRRK